MTPGHATLLLLAGVALAIAAAPAAAAPTPPGARVRVTILRRSPADGTLGPGPRFTGTLVASSPDTIVVDRGGDAARREVLHRAAVRLEASEWRSSGSGRGALYGLLVGGAGGTIVGLTLANTESFGENQKPYEKAVPIVLGVGGALVGAGLGAIVGGFFHRERWREVSPGEPAPR